MLTECDTVCFFFSSAYVGDSSSSDPMHAFQSKDDWVKAQHHKVNKPIDVDTLLWVRQRLMRLEVESRWADRICLFEEFFPNDAMVPRI